MSARRPRKLLGLAASLLSLLPAGCAHAPHSAASSSVPPLVLAATPASKPPQANSGSIEEVSVDLVVRNKRHQPVLDLDSSQLAVSDAGTPVQLTSMHRVDLTSGPPRLAAFVFDRMNPANSAAARRTAGKILKVVPDQGYSLSVLQVNGRLHLLQGYTQDFHAVDAAFAPATSPLSTASALTQAEKTLTDPSQAGALSLSSSERAQGKILLSALQESQRILDDRHSYPSLAGLQALVESLRPVEGRKFIFYFCSGLAPDSDSREMLRSIVGLANRVGVTIYVVDVNPQIASMSSVQQASQASSILGNTTTLDSVSAFGVTGAGATASAAFNAALAHNVAGFEFGSVDVYQSPLVTLSSGTGGLYINALSGSQRDMQQLHQELTTWYQASWMPPIQSYDGQFRPIDIHSPRKDLVIRTRSGYFAVPPSGVSQILPFETPLLKILAAPRLPSDLPIHSTILHLGVLPDGNFAELVVQVPISKLEVQEDADTHLSTVQADFLAVIKDSKGTVLERFGDSFPLHRASEAFRPDSTEAITLARPFSADPGFYTLETAVMDRIGNKSAAQRTTFTIEAPKSGPALSDIALVQSVEPVEEDQGTFQPMQYNNGRIVPRAAADLPGNINSLSFFFLIHPVAGSQGQPVLRMQISRNGKLLTDLPMELHTVSGTGAAVPYLASLNGHAFAPGDYQVKALLNQAGSTAQSSSSFKIERDGSAPNELNSAQNDDKDLPPGERESASLISPEFALTPLKDPMPPPTNAAIQEMLEAARQRALAWSDSLKNFVCLEVTNHFVNAPEDVVWKQRGTLVERMQYVDHAQTRTTLMLNGDPSSVGPDRLEFFHSNGEFGAMFHIIFNPSAKTVFTWKQSSILDGQPVQVFAFKVERANSNFNLSDRYFHSDTVGFSGLIYLDPSTSTVRRVAVVVDDIPARLLIHACTMSIDYSWIAMQDHDFLLPTRGAVSLQETKKRPVLNEFTFRNYRRFGSQVRILPVGQPGTR